MPSEDQAGAGVEEGLDDGGDQVADLLGLRAARDLVRDARREQDCQRGHLLGKGAAGWRGSGRRAQGGHGDSVLGCPAEVATGRKKDTT